MGKALQAYRRYRELADRGEFGRVGEVLDQELGSRTAWG